MISINSLVKDGIINKLTKNDNQSKHKSVIINIKYVDSTQDLLSQAYLKTLKNAMKSISFPISRLDGLKDKWKELESKLIDSIDFLIGQYTLSLKQNTELENVWDDNTIKELKNLLEESKKLAKNNNDNGVKSLMLDFASTDLAVTSCEKKIKELEALLSNNNTNYEKLNTTLTKDIQLAINVYNDFQKILNENYDRYSNDIKTISLEQKKLLELENTALKKLESTDIEKLRNTNYENIDKKSLSKYTLEVVNNIFSYVNVINLKCNKILCLKDDGAVDNNATSKIFKNSFKNFKYFYKYYNKHIFKNKYKKIKDADDLKLNYNSTMVTLTLLSEDINKFKEIKLNNLKKIELINKISNLEKNYDGKDNYVPFKELYDKRIKYDLYKNLIDLLNGKNNKYQNLYQGLNKGDIKKLLSEIYTNSVSGIYIKSISDVILVCKFPKEHLKLQYNELDNIETQIETCNLEISKNKEEWEKLIKTNNENIKIKQIDKKIERYHVLIKKLTKIESILLIKNDILEKTVTKLGNIKNNCNAFIEESEKITNQYGDFYMYTEKDTFQSNSYGLPYGRWQLYRFIKKFSELIDDNLKDDYNKIKQCYDRTITKIDEKSLETYNEVSNQIYSHANKGYKGKLSNGIVDDAKKILKHKVLGKK